MKTEKLFTTFQGSIFFLIFSFYLLIYFFFALLEVYLISMLLVTIQFNRLRKINFTFIDKKRLDFYSCLKTKYCL